MKNYWYIKDRDYDGIVTTIGRDNRVFLMITVNDGYRIASSKLNDPRSFNDYVSSIAATSVNFSTIISGLWWPLPVVLIADDHYPISTVIDVDRTVIGQLFDKTSDGNVIRGLNAVIGQVIPTINYYNNALIDDAIDCWNQEISPDDNRRYFTDIDITDRCDLYVDQSIAINAGILSESLAIGNSIGKRIITGDYRSRFGGGGPKTSSNPLS